MNLTACVGREDLSVITVLDLPRVAGGLTLDRPPFRNAE